MNQPILPDSDLLPATIGERVRDALPSLSPQLRKAARYVLDHPREVGVSSISALAEAAGVTPNTLVRLARALGCEGYDGLREPFRELLVSGRQDFPDRARRLQSVARGERHGELFTEIARDALSNVEELYAGTGAAALKRAADAIVAAHATFVLGVGIAAGPARGFAYLAGMALPTVAAIPRDGSPPVDHLVRAGAGDLLLAIGFRPYRREVVQAVQTAHEQGVEVIAVTDSLASPLALQAAHVFCVPTETAQFFTSTVALAALLETLMAFVIADAPDEVVASIERFHRRRRELGVYLPEDE